MIMMKYLQKPGRRPPFTRAGCLARFLLVSLPLATKLCEREMHRASTKYDIPIGILYAVGLD